MATTTNVHIYYTAMILMIRYDIYTLDPLVSLFGEKLSILSLFFYLLCDVYAHAYIYTWSTMQWGSSY